METFGLIGLPFGLIGFVFALNALNQVSELERKLKEAGVLDDERKSR